MESQLKFFDAYNIFGLIHVKSRKSVEFGQNYTLLASSTYSHHWLSVTIHFNRYNLCFDKYIECRDKCKPLYFIALHIRVVPPLFSPLWNVPLSDTRCWVIGHFRRYVTERLLNAKVVVFLGFLWFAVWFFFPRGYLIIELIIELGNFCRIHIWFAWKSVEQLVIFVWKSVTNLFYSLRKV